MLCVSGETPHRTEFFLLTRDREKLGSTIFDNDDVTYDMMPLVLKTPSAYQYEANSSYIEVDRKSLVVNAAGKTHDCELHSISNLHKAAERYLRVLLGENKI